jgi:hypothetical protein
VLDVSLFGAGLHVRTTDPHGTEIKKYFDDTHIDSQVRRIEATMEDVFVSMIERADGGKK